MSDVTSNASVKASASHDSRDFRARGPNDSDALTRLLTERQLEEMLNVGRGWAAKDRLGAARIPHVKIGRSVRYRLADAMAFIEASVRKSTSDAGNHLAARG